MRASLLLLALILALPFTLAGVSAGCTLSHSIGGGSDAGRADGGEPPPPGCRPGGPATIDGLACPGAVLEGDPVFVDLTYYPSACCSSGAGEVSMSTSSTGTEHLLRASFTSLCECCDLCACLGPYLSESVDLGPLPIGLHTVTAGDASCLIEVRPRFIEVCGPVPVTELILPRVLLDEQDLTVTARSEPSSLCSCGPSLAPVGASLTELELGVCDCCEDCECIDRGYEASYVGRNPTSGLDHVITVNGEERPLAERSSSSCREVFTETLTWLPPREDLIRGGPRVDWVRGTFHGSYCCVEPMAGATLDPPDPSGARAMHVYDCSPPDPCDCVPDPIEVEALFPLVDLPSGAHTVHSGRVQVFIEVP